MIAHGELWNLTKKETKKNKKQYFLARILDEDFENFIFINVWGDVMDIPKKIQEYKEKGLARLKVQIYVRNSEPWVADGKAMNQFSANRIEVIDNDSGGED